MPLPNLLIVGAQKSGTTWLHRSLGKSTQVFATKKKELNFFNIPDYDSPERVAEYMENFPAEPIDGVKYYMESTPHYFKLPPLVAKNIKAMLGSPTLLTVFRNPIERYESAYTHHMLAGRFPYTPEIDDLVDDHKEFSLGKYGEILEAWWKIHPDLKPHIYDDLLADPVGFVGGVMDFLELENDIAPADLDFRTNDKTVKHDKKGLEWEQMPVLTESLRERLAEAYAEDVALLGQLMDRDLSHWLKPSA